MGRGLIVLLAGALLAGCVKLGNREALKRYAPFQGVQSIAVFLQHWPVYVQKPDRHDPREDFIRPQTVFWGPWQRAAQVPPRALDLQDLGTEVVGRIVMDVLERKGYRVYWVPAPPEGDDATVERLMARFQETQTPVDAFLFGYFSPTLFVSQARDVLPGHTHRSFSLEEIVAALAPGRNSVIWVGERTPQSPPRSISHVFIYWTMTIFRPDGRLLMAQADARTGGPVRPWIPRCPPPATTRDYPASPEVISRLVLNNFRCRLEGQIPFAF